VFLSEVATSETVQFSCDSTCATEELPSQPPVTPTVSKPSSLNPHCVDHTFSILCSENQSSRGQAVGIASIVDGNMLHGQVIPHGYTNVVIEYIQLGTMPKITNFDEEELCAGQFTAWDTACIMYDSP